jgi:hypothetical protein
MVERPLHEWKIEPANYAGPFKMLDGARVTDDDGTPATVEQVDKIAQLFRLKSICYWSLLARRARLTEAQAAAIIKADYDEWLLSSDLAENVPGMLPTY